MPVCESEISESLSVSLASLASSVRESSSGVPDLDRLVLVTSLALLALLVTSLSLFPFVVTRGLSEAPPRLLRGILLALNSFILLNLCWIMVGLKLCYRRMYPRKDSQAWTHPQTKWKQSDSSREDSS